MDWEFVQSVGGIQLGDPYIRDGLYMVPIIVNLSGSQSITTQPTVSNTGLVCIGLFGDARGDILGIDVWVTILVEQESENRSPRRNSWCPDYQLGQVETGIGYHKWTIYYRDHPESERTKNYLIGVAEF